MNAPPKSDSIITAIAPIDCAPRSVFADAPISSCSAAAHTVKPTPSEQQRGDAAELKAKERAAEQAHADQQHREPRDEIQQRPAEHFPRPHRQRENPRVNRPRPIAQQQRRHRLADEKDAEQREAGKDRRQECIAGIRLPAVIGGRSTATCVGAVAIAASR